MNAALFVRRGGAYYGLTGVDPWDERRAVAIRASGEKGYLALRLQNRAANIAMARNVAARGKDGEK